MDVGLGGHLEDPDAAHSASSERRPMKIVNHGVVIISKQDIRVEGWLVTRESTDPPESEATHEQLVLETVIPWAQKKMNAAILQNLQRISKDIKAAKNPTEN
jgi:hypothetical protein